MTIDVEHVGAVLLCTRGHKEVDHGDPVAAPPRELAFRRHRNGPRLGVHAQVPEPVEPELKALVVGRRSRAVEGLQAGRRAQAVLVLVVIEIRTHEG